MTTLEAPQGDRVFAVRWLTGGRRSVVLAAAVVAGLLVAWDPVLGFGAVLVGVLGVAVSQRPDLATLAAAVLLYSNAAVVAHRVHGLPRFVGQAAGLLLLVALAHRLGVLRRPLVLPRALPGLVLLVVVMVTGAVRAEEPLVALEAVQDYLTGGLFLFLAFANAVRSEQLLRRVLWSLLLVGALLGTLSVHQSVTGNFEDDYLGFAQVKEETLEARLWEDEEDLAAPRLAGPIGEKNYYAQVMFSLVPIGLVFFASRVRRRGRGVALLMVGVIVAGGAATLSRGGAIGLALGIVFLVARRHLPARHLLVIVVGVVVLLSTSPRYGERLASIGSSVTGLVDPAGGGGEMDRSTQGRIGENIAGLRVFAEHPIVGVGPGMFPFHYRDQAIEAGYHVHEGTRVAHNLYIQALAELGLIGFAGLAGATWITLRECARARRRVLPLRPDVAVLLSACIGAMSVYLACGLFLSLAYQRYFWFLLALCAAGTAVARELAPAPADEVAAPRGLLPRRVGRGAG